MTDFLAAVSPGFKPGDVVDAAGKMAVPGAGAGEDKKFAPAESRAASTRRWQRQWGYPVFDAYGHLT